MNDSKDGGGGPRDGKAPGDGNRGDDNKGDRKADGSRPRRRAGRPRRRRGKGPGEPQATGVPQAVKEGGGNESAGRADEGPAGPSREGDRGGRGQPRDESEKGSGSSSRRRGKRPSRGRSPGAETEAKQQQGREDAREGRQTRPQRERRSRGDDKRSRGSSRTRPSDGTSPVEKDFLHKPPVDEMVVEAEKMFEGSSEDYASMAEEEIDFLKPHEVDEEFLYEDMPERNFEEMGRLMDVVGVKLHDSGAIVEYDCQDTLLDINDEVIVETGRGLALGRVLVPTTRRMVRKEKIHRIIRKASTNDMRQRERNVSKEKQAQELCRQSIERFKLDMKLIKVDYLHGGNKAIFYFSAEGRVDFRDLVRELARKLHIRVEMRQIGVRDASRMLGGLGTCGLRLCCNRYIREFEPVSIRMAKDQDLVLNPEKVSGLCGRLMCCLAYEDAVYREASRSMPRVGRRVITPEGEGRIRDRDVLKRVVRVQLPDLPGLHEFSVEEISPAGGNQPAKADEIEEVPPAGDGE